MGGLHIFQLEYEACKQKAKVVDGYEMWLSLSPLRRNTFGYAGYATIESNYTPEEKRLITSIHSYIVKELGDGFKKITLGISDSVAVEKEDAIFLMVGMGVDNIRTENGRKIAGRFFDEGIFILQPNDQIAVTRGGVTEEFVAIQFEGQMYLIKKHKRNTDN